MTRSVIYFHLEPGARAPFIETFKRISVLETSSFQGGYRGEQLRPYLSTEPVGQVFEVLHDVGPETQVHA
jgi:hypothetical protein